MENKLTLEQAEFALNEAKQELKYAMNRYNLDVAYTRAQIASAETQNRSAQDIAALKDAYYILNRSHYKAVEAWGKKVSAAYVPYNQLREHEIFEMIMSDTNSR